jgi:hypothetical protein
MLCIMGSWLFLFREIHYVSVQGAVYLRLPWNRHTYLLISIAFTLHIHYCVEIVERRTFWKYRIETHFCFCYCLAVQVCVIFLCAIV